MNNNLKVLSSISITTLPKTIYKNRMKIVKCLLKFTYILEYRINFIQVISN